jgi:hypothetical protein
VHPDQASLVQNIAVKNPTPEAIPSGLDYFQLNEQVVKIIKDERQKMFEDAAEAQAALEKRRAEQAREQTERTQAGEGASQSQNNGGSRSDDSTSGGSDFVGSSPATSPDGPQLLRIVMFVQTDCHPRERLQMATALLKKILKQVSLNSSCIIYVSVISRYEKAAESKTVSGINNGNGFSPDDSRCAAPKSSGKLFITLIFASP